MPLYNISCCILEEGVYYPNVALFTNTQTITMNIKLRAVGFLLKPFDDESLLELIDAACRGIKNELCVWYHFGKKTYYKKREI